MPQNPLGSPPRFDVREFAAKPSTAQSLAGGVDRFVQALLMRQELEARKAMDEARMALTNQQIEESRSNIELARSREARAEEVHEGKLQTEAQTRAQLESSAQSIRDALADTNTPVPEGMAPELVIRLYSRAYEAITPTDQARFQTMRDVAGINARSRAAGQNQPGVLSPKDSRVGRILTTMRQLEREYMAPVGIPLLSATDEQKRALATGEPGYELRGGKLYTPGLPPEEARVKALQTALSQLQGFFEPWELEQLPAILQGFASSDVTTNIPGLGEITLVRNFSDARMNAIMQSLTDAGFSLDDESSITAYLRQFFPDNEVEEILREIRMRQGGR